MKMTGKLLLAAATVAGFSGSAMAADLSYQAPAAAPVMQAPAQSDWDGPYIGANLGYGWGTATDTSGGFGTASLTGWLVGGQVGYNFHLSDNIVAGIEGNLDWENETGSNANGSLRINGEGSIRGRLGIDLDGILPYAEAGVAFANATASDPTGTTSVSATHTGYTLGAGIEFKVADHVSANVEYRYSNYGNQTYNGTTIGLTDNTVRVGLNYHF